MAKYKKYADWDTARNELKNEPKGKRSIGAAFSEKNFNSLLDALVNNVDFKQEVVKYTAKGANIKDVRDVYVTKEFRTFLKGILIQAGMDDADASSIESPDFRIKNVEGLYPLISASIYEWMKIGNQFAFMPQKDCIATIGIRKHAKTDIIKDVNDIHSGRKITKHIVTQEYIEVCGKSHAPAYLVNSEEV